MKESVAIAKDAAAKKDFSPTRSGNNIHRVRNEHERQLGSLRGVIGNITRDGGTPSVDNIATELSSMHTAQRASALLALQRTHGNRYVQRIVTGIQAKLKVGQPGDIYEEEADRVADVVTHMSDPQVQRQPEEEEEEEELIQTKPLADHFTPLIQRPVEVEEEEILQTKENPDLTPEVTPELESWSLRGGGQPLLKSERAFFEPRFGQDFSHVRIHSNLKAAEMARALNARAFTVGCDIVFGTRQYAPGTTKGRKLLAHELTHTLQQRHSVDVARFPLKINPSNDMSERQADRVADSVMCESDANVQLALSEPIIQRACPPPERLGGIPSPEACIEADPNTRVPDQFRIPLRFCYDSDDLIDSDAGNIAALRSRLEISTLAAGRSVHIHGYASPPGRVTYNRRLACHRAVAVKNMLALRTLNPINLYSHGATSIFGPPQDENQRVIVTVERPPTPTPPPPPIPARAAGPFLDLQIACVIDEGGCGPSANIPFLDTWCRSMGNTGYTGVAVVHSDLVCSTPGMGIALSLGRAYPNWRSVLHTNYPCPCTRADAISHPDFSWDWGSAMPSHHPGSAACYRSISVASVPGHGQQCCYNARGMLITYGSGAGTPDVWHWRDSWTNHQRIDYQSYTDLNSDWRIYNRYWVPDIGVSCGPAADPCINRCDQELERCLRGSRNGGMVCIIRSQRCQAACPRP